MADKVQGRLETLLPALVELKARQLFDDIEIREIVKKRREFEYRCVSQACSKKDYLEYIRYEITLEALRNHRCQTARLVASSAINSSGISHIINLFNRAVAIWPQDTMLWNQFVDFTLRSGATKQALAVLLRALAFHPRELNFWLLAADREFQMGHLEAPRRLLQLALRQVPDSLLLWTDFFRFECECIIQLFSARTSSGNSGDENKSVGVEHLCIVLRNGMLGLKKDSEKAEFFISCLYSFSNLLKSPGVPYMKNLDELEGALQETLTILSRDDPLLKFVSWKLQLLAKRDLEADELLTHDVPCGSVLEDPCLVKYFPLLVYNLGFSAAPTPAQSLFRMDSSADGDLSEVDIDESSEAPTVFCKLESVFTRPKASLTYNPLGSSMDTFLQDKPGVLRACLLATSSSYPSLFPHVPLPSVPESMEQHFNRERELLRRILKQQCKCKDDEMLSQYLCKWLLQRIRSADLEEQHFSLVFRVLEEMTSHWTSSLKVLEVWKDLFEVLNSKKLDSNNQKTSKFLRFALLKEYVKLKVSESLKNGSKDSSTDDSEICSPLSVGSLCFQCKEKVDINSLKGLMCLAQEQMRANKPLWYSSHSSDEGNRKKRKLSDDSSESDSRATRRIRSRRPHDVAPVNNSPPSAAPVSYECSHDKKADLSRFIDNLFRIARRADLRDLTVQVLQHLLLFQNDTEIAVVKDYAKRSQATDFCLFLHPTERECVRRILGLSVVTNSLEKLSSASLWNTNPSNLKMSDSVEPFISLIENCIRFDETAANQFTCNEMISTTAILLSPPLATETLIQKCNEACIILQALFELKGYQADYESSGKLLSLIKGKNISGKLKRSMSVASSINANKSEKELLSSISELLQSLLI